MWPRLCGVWPSWMAPSRSLSVTGTILLSSSPNARILLYEYRIMVALQRIVWAKWRLEACVLAECVMARRAQIVFCISRSGSPRIWRLFRADYWPSYAHVDRVCCLLLPKRFVWLVLILKLAFIYYVFFEPRLMANWWRSLSIRLLISDNTLCHRSKTSLPDG